MSKRPSNSPLNLLGGGSSIAGFSSRNFYLSIRKLHLYLGLFISPYLLVFALSTITLNHNWRLGAESDSKDKTPLSTRQIKPPAGEGSLAQAKDILGQLNLTGEIGYINHLQREGRLIFPVMKPGLEIDVEFNFRNNTATVEQRQSNFWKRLVYLHKSPGPHNANIRGNWLFTRLWWVLADSTVYLLLFLTAGGVYLWTVIRAERKPGLIFLGLGMACFFLIALVLSH